MFHHQVNQKYSWKLRFLHFLIFQFRFWKLLFHFKITVFDPFNENFRLTWWWNNLNVQLRFIWNWFRLIRIFQKKRFSFLDSVFALDQYIRELTRVVIVDFFSLSRRYVTDVSLARIRKMQSFIPAQTHTLTTSGSLLLAKGAFLPLLISTTQQGRTLTTLCWCSKSCFFYQSQRFLQRQKNDILTQLELVPFKFYSDFIFFTTVSDNNTFAVWNIYKVTDRSTFLLIKKQNRTNLTC